MRICSLRLSKSRIRLSESNDTAVLLCSTMVPTAEAVTVAVLTIPATAVVGPPPPPAAAWPPRRTKRFERT